jgi:hypothetical protein
MGNDAPTLDELRKKVDDTRKALEAGRNGGVSGHRQKQLELEADQAEEDLLAAGGEVP